MPPTDTPVTDTFERHRPVGRRPRLNASMIERLAAIAQTGMSDRSIADELGIGRSTFYTWINQGENFARLAREGHHITERQRRFVEFVDTLSRARARAETRAAQALHRAMQPRRVTRTRTITKPNGDVHVVEEEWEEFDWRPALAYLKARHGDEWSEVQRHEMSGPDGGAIVLDAEAGAERALSLLAEVATKRARSTGDATTDDTSVTVDEDDAG